MVTEILKDGRGQRAQRHENLPELHSWRNSRVDWNRLPPEPPAPKCAPSFPTGFPGGFGVLREGNDSGCHVAVTHSTSFRGGTCSADGQRESTCAAKSQTHGVRLWLQRHKYAALRKPCDYSKNHQSANRTLSVNPHSRVY